MEMQNEKLEAQIIDDLAQKARSDMQRALQTTLDLGAAVLGPAAVHSIMFHVAGSFVRLLGLTMATTRDFDRGGTPAIQHTVSNDDFLIVALFLYASYQRETEGDFVDTIADSAVKMFKTLTGREPDLAAHAGAPAR